MAKSGQDGRNNTHRSGIQGLDLDESREEIDSVYVGEFTAKRF